MCPIPRLILALPVLLAALSACTVKSIQPAYTKDAVVTDPIVVGNWVDDKGDIALAVSPAPDGYDVSVTAKGKEPRTVNLRATLFRVGGAGGAKGPLFADIVLADADWKKFEWAHDFVLRTHAIAKVETTAGSLGIAMINPRKLDELLKKSDEAVEHLHLNGNGTILSAGPEGMMKFLAAHAGELFEETTKLKRAPAKPE